MKLREAFDHVTATCRLWANGCEPGRIARLNTALETVRIALAQGLADGLNKTLADYKEHHRPKLHTDLPDSDLVVLLVTTDPEYPVWPGFHDGEQWRSCDASTLEGSIIGWLHLCEAFLLLNPK